MITIEQLVREIRPNRTVLFFGAGSSMPSGLPSGNDLRDTIASDFSIAGNSFNLAECALLAEIKTNRSKLIESLRNAIGKPSPTGALLNLPIYPWKSIFTTNFDELIENSYKRRDKGLVVYHTNYDFSKEVKQTDQLLFKLHGTIGSDVSDGHNSRIIITQTDYDKTSEFRESVYDRFAAELAGADLVIIGQKLDDGDIKSVVDRALSIQSKLFGAAGTITLVLFERDEERATIFENRGIRVCFGGIDEFFAGMAALAAKDITSTVPTGDPLDIHIALRPSTVDVRHSAEAFSSNVSSMFNGRPATYADIAARLTFDRSVSNNIVRIFTQSTNRCAGIIGASGVGKTTAARQVAMKLLSEGWQCWEHKSDFTLLSDEWIGVARQLEKSKQLGLLIVDEAHACLQSLNELLESLSSKSLDKLKIVYTSSRGQWQPRIKTPVIFKEGREFWLTQLNSLEIDRLITLVESADMIRPLVENSFSGFSRQQKRNRLVDRCEQDMFVCLKNIFASEKFDDIILREFNELPDNLQNIYRIVAAMESSGIRVHRQLVIRLLGIRADQINNILEQLSDVIAEYDISAKQWLYGWKVRHQVIADIITKYKFHNPAEIVRLFDRVIDNLSPSYEIERRTINEICNFDVGLGRISDKSTQNRLLRRLISLAPGERVPRHRLIRNLIEDDQFDLAETEIRVFESDLGRDGPVARYRAVLLFARAVHTKGLSDQDRLVILDKAKASATASQERFPNNRNLFATGCDIGLHIYRLSGDRTAFDASMNALKRAEIRLADPEVTKLVRTYERRITSVIPPVPS